MTARLLVVGLAVASLGATTWLFIRETKPFGDTRLAAVKAHLSAADLRAIEVPVDYTDAVPVLTYHDVSTRPGPYAVTPQMFAKQMAALRRGGFHTVSLDQVRDLVQGRRTSLPSRPVLLTFDDGVSTDYTRADAILAANHFRAAAFVVTSRLGDGRKPSYYLSWPQVRKMAHSGRWEFGSETDAGASESSTLSAGDLARSAAKLRHALGAAPYAFAFPVTRSSLPAKRAALADVERVVAGRFSLGFVTDLHAPHAIDATSDPLLLPRFAVTAQLDVAGLADALRHMVPSPPGHAVPSWGIEGPACDVTAKAVTTHAAGYALCRSSLYGSQWTDYRLTMAATGLVERSTLVVLCRTGGDGDVELSVGSRLAVLRQLVGGHYTTLGSCATLPPGPGGTHTVTIEVVGRRASVVVDGVALGRVRFSRLLAAGVPGLGIAGGGVVTVTGAVADDLRATAARR